MERRSARLEAGNILQWLLGEWRLSREVPGVAIMQGHAVFAGADAEGDTAEYTEAVRVQMADAAQCFRGEQRYLYRQQEEGLAVYFAPPSLEAGTLFHLLRFSVIGETLRADAEHQCKADVYASEYIIPLSREIGLETDTFTVHHHVSGPRKQYSLLTRYQRLPARPGAPMTVNEPLR